MINWKNISIKIIERFENNTTEIWVFEYTGGSKGICYTYNGEGNIVGKEMNELDSLVDGGLKPFLSLPRIFGAAFMNSLVELHLQKGYKPKESSFIEGKIQSQEKHLEDMQKMTFMLLEKIVKK